MVNLKAALEEQLLNVAVAEWVAQIPGDGLQDQRCLEVAALEVVFGPTLQLLDKGVQDHRPPPVRRRICRPQAQRGVNAKNFATRPNTFRWLVENGAPLLPGGGVTHGMELGLNWLIRHRDHWTHFGVTSLGISVASARSAVRAALDLIAELPLPTPRHGEDHEHRRKVTLAALRELLRPHEGGL